MVHTYMHAYIYIVLNCLISFPVHAHYGKECIIMCMLLCVCIHGHAYMYVVCLHALLCVSSYSCIHTFF